MNHLVQLLTDDEKDATNNTSWHLVDPANDQGPMALCTGEFFGFRESACEFKEKWLKIGGITCPDCIKKLTIYKSVRM